MTNNSSNPASQTGGKIPVQVLTKMALCLALMCVSAYIVIPIPFTPAMITAQTIIVNLIALLLNPAQSAIVMGVYILMGICGLPIFSGGTSGIGRILGPTGGFIIGFLIAAVLISLLKGKTNNVGRYILVTICVGMPVIYFFGTISMCIFNSMDVRAALLAAVVPFLVGDVAKCVAAALLATGLNRILVKARLAV